MSFVQKKIVSENHLMCNINHFALRAQAQSPPPKRCYPTTSLYGFTTLNT